MEIKISAKEFKNVVAGIEKAVTKKAKEVFENVKLKIDNKSVSFEAQNIDDDVFGILKINAETYNFDGSCNESFDLDIKDLKEISKIKADSFTISDISNGKVLFDAGKKKIVVNKKPNNDFSNPTLEDMELICETTCKELLDSFTRLSKVLSKDNNNKVFRCYRLCSQFIECLDGHRIMRKATNEKETCFFSDNVDLLINGKDFDILKNVLTQNKDNKLHISINHKYYCISCETFCYIGQRIEGKPFNTSRIFDEECFDKKVIVDTKDFLDIVKYNNKISSKNSHTILGTKNNQFFSFHPATNMESFDIVDTKENNVADGFHIAASPKYLLDVFSVLNEDETEMSFLDYKSPIRIKNGDIDSVVLPINIRGDFIFETINKFFEEKIFGNFEKKTEEKLEETEKLEEVEEVENYIKEMEKEGV